MSPYILILMFVMTDYRGGISISSVPSFDTQTACETAGKAILDRNPDRRGNAQASFICVRKY